MRLLLLLAAGCVGGLTPAPAQNLDLTEVAPGVFAAIPRPGTVAGANSAFIVTQEYVIVVDTHMGPSFARELLAEIHARTALPVRYVINTHWHPDHTQGNAAHVADYPDGTLFIAHELTRHDMATHGVRRLSADLQRLPLQIARLEGALASLTGPAARTTRAQLERDRSLLRELEQARILLADVTFERSLTLYADPVDVHILFMGAGHTRGDAVVYLPQQRVAVVGDLVTGGPPFARDGYPSQWIETLTELERLDLDLIVTGHGAVRTGKRVIRDRIAFLQAALNVVNRGLADGMDPAAIANEIDIESFRPTFDPEPADRPWRAWMRMIVDGVMAERKTR